MPLEFLNDSQYDYNHLSVSTKLHTMLPKFQPSNEIEQKKFNEFLEKTNNNGFNPSLHELNYLLKAPDYLWIPYVLFRHDFNRLAKDRMSTKFPLYLLIEPTSICNLRCVMCFQADKSFGDQKSFMGRMSMDLLKTPI